MDKINVRALIVDSLTEMERDKTFLSAVETSVSDKYDHMDPRDMAFYKKVMDGTTELRIRIDHILDSFSKTPVKKMKPVIRACMRMSVYQIMWMDSVPDSAVCNEAVKLVASRGLAGLKGYVNGTLRNISRNKDNIGYPSKEEDLITYLSIMYSCPEWIAKLFVSQFGEDRAERILASFLEDKPVSVRVRPVNKEGETVNAEDLSTSWISSGADVKVNPHIPYGYLLSHAGPVTALEGFGEGAITVQDTGSMMVAELSGAKAGDRIMDLCAAPGGKSIHIADKLCKLNRTTDATLCKPNETDLHSLCKPNHILAYDVSEARCARISENINRLGLKDIITVQAHDATEFIPELEGLADIVVADVPCSGLGVLGHKSDIKYRIGAEDIDSLKALQRQIIDNAVRYVRPGGRLIYSTCTLNRGENEEQAGYIMDTCNMVDITMESLQASDVTPPENYTESSAGLTIYPDTWTSDGFYICVLRKGNTTV